MMVQRDPFARGEYERVCIPNRLQTLDCAWCGSKPPRLYTYQWQRDDRPEPASRQLKRFCNYRCFESFSH